MELILIALPVIYCDTDSTTSYKNLKEILEKWIWGDCADNTTNFEWNKESEK